MKKTSFIFLLLSSFCYSALANTPNWDIDASYTFTSGRYVDSTMMRDQTGAGIRISAEKNSNWGVIAGLQSTRINMSNISPSTQINQDNLLFSTFLHSLTETQPGRLTFQLDIHQINNNSTTGNSDGVRAYATNLTWVSQNFPMKIVASYAKSNYQNTSEVQQFFTGIGLGFNDSKNWAEIRHYKIYDLSPLNALGAEQMQSIEFLITQRIHGGQSSFLPNTITFNSEFGHKIYNIDMTNKILYNLPMRNDGGRNISAIWQINTTNALTLNVGKMHYSSDLPTAHNFTLNTISTQLSTNWK
jgi:hypothetical protein